MAKKDKKSDEQHGLPQNSVDIPMPSVPSPKGLGTEGVNAGQGTPIRVQDAEELHLAPNSVLLVRSGNRSVEQQVIRINRGFRVQGIPNLVLVVPDDTKVELLDEVAMNRAGWYRKDEQ